MGWQNDEEFEALSWQATFQRKGAAPLPSRSFVSQIGKRLLLDRRMKSALAIID
jgi:hypothetical protein